MIIRLILALHYRTVVVGDGESVTLMADDSGAMDRFRAAQVLLAHSQPSVRLPIYMCQLPSYSLLISVMIVVNRADCLQRSGCGSDSPRRPHIGGAVIVMLHRILAPTYARICCSTSKCVQFNAPCTGYIGMRKYSDYSYQARPRVACEHSDWLIG